MPGDSGTADIKLKDGYGDEQNYASINHVEVPKQVAGDATFYLTGDASAEVTDVLSGKTFYNGDGKMTGSVVDYCNGQPQTTITITNEETITGPKFITGTVTFQVETPPLSDAWTITYYSRDDNYDLYKYNVDFVIHQRSVAAPPADPPLPNESTDVFAGWFDDPTAGNKIIFPFTPAQNTNIYAHFVDKNDPIGVVGMSSQSGQLTFTGAISNVPKYTTRTLGRYTLVDNELDNFFPFNQITEVQVNNNVFIRIPKMYIKWDTVVIDEDETSVLDGFSIAQTPTTGYFLPDCFKASEDQTGNYLYIGKYEGGDGGAPVIFSQSGRPCRTNLSRGYARQITRGAGDIGVSRGQNWDLSIRTLYIMLCMMYFKTSNLREHVFAGRTGGSQGNLTYSSISKTGMCDPLDTLDNSSPVKSGWDSYSNCFRMLGVENPYGNIAEWVDGVTITTPAGVGAGIIWVERFPENFSDVASTPTAKTMPFIRPNANGWVTNMGVGVASSGGDGLGTLSYALPRVIGNTGASEYFGCYYEYDSASTVFTTGGAYSSGSYAGGVYYNLTNTTADASSTIGCRLCYRGIN